MSLRELEPQLSGLSKAEKAEIVQRFALEIANVSPGIELIPGVAGGAACIIRTRIPVWTLEHYRRLGWNEARILENYPTLRAVDLVNAWAYAAAHPEEINGAIADNESA
jgi:uncharacterized protein (DUF433 family)